MDRCPECGEKDFRVLPEGIICRRCGFVLDDTPFEERPYIAQNIKNNAKHPFLASAGSMPLNGRVVKHQWLLSTKEKNLNKAKNRLALITSHLKVPSHVEKDAFLIYKTAIDKKLNIGRNNLVILYASVYSACIIHGIPKTLLELTAHSDVEPKKIIREFKRLKQELNLKIAPIDPLDCLHRFGSRLNLKPQTITLASEILTKIKSHPLVIGKKPKTIVATVIYIASKINEDYVTQREITNATGVIEVTIRKRSRELIKIIN